MPIKRRLLIATGTVLATFKALMGKDTQALPATITVGNSGSIPAQAVAAGFTTPVVMNEFTSLSEVQMTPGATGSGYNWYNTNPYGKSPFAPNQVTQSGSVLTLMPPGSGNSPFLSNGNAGLMSFVNSSGGTVQLCKHGHIPANTGNGRVFNGGYFEARIAFDPTIAGQSGGWPGFFAFCWSGVAGAFVNTLTTDSSEIDILEYFSDHGLAMSIHEWHGHTQTGQGFPPQLIPGNTTANPNGTGPWTCSISNGDGTIISTSNPINLGTAGNPIFNTYGMLWVPSEGVSFWINNQCVGFMPINPTNPAGSGSTFGIGVNNGYQGSINDYNFLSLSCGNAPMMIDFVHVYQ